MKKLFLLFFMTLLPMFVFAYDFEDGQVVDVYLLNGEKRGSAVGKNGTACIDYNIKLGSVVVVKMGDKSVKVIVK